MCVAQFVDFKRTGRGGSSQPGSWMESRTFHIALFDAINRRNEQPNIIFS